MSFHSKWAERAAEKKGINHFLIHTTVVMENWLVLTPATNHCVILTLLCISIIRLIFFFLSNGMLIPKVIFQLLSFSFSLSTYRYGINFMILQQGFDYFYPTRLLSMEHVHVHQCWGYLLVQSLPDWKYEHPHICQKKHVSAAHLGSSSYSPLSVGSRKRSKPSKP